MREILLDLIIDIRCAERDGFPGYAAMCRQQLRTLWPYRHTGVAHLDVYGWPSALLGHAVEQSSERAT